MHDFPTELHAHIATFLRYPPDLASLCRVSSYWLSIARPLLYHTLILKDHLTTLNDTLALLGRDYELTKSIVSLTLITHSIRLPGWRNNIGAPQPWIWLSDLAGLDNVRRFKLDGVPAMPAGQFQQIFANIYRMSKVLEEIECVDTTDTCGSLESRDGTFETFSDIPISLKKVTYTNAYPPDKTLRILCTTIIHPLTPSITFLEISIEHEDLVGPEFRHLRLPKLNTLIMHKIQQIYVLRIPQCYSIFEFLKEHPTIHTLDLPNCPILAQQPGMPNNILPELSSLTLRVASLLDLSTMVSNIAQIMYLSLLEVHPIRESSSALQTFRSETGGFQLLKRFLLCRSRCDYINKVLQYFDGSIDIEWCTLSFPVADQSMVKRLIHSLSKYSKLTRIDFGGENIVTRDQMQHAADIIPSLKKIFLFRTHRKRMEVTSIYDVQRNEDGSALLKRTYQLPDRGPYVQDRRVIPLHSIDWREDLLLDGWSDCIHVHED